MSKTVEIGKRVVPVEQIALIEPFDPETQKNMRSTRPFRARIVLLNRDSILSETDPLVYAEELGFRVLSNDPSVSTNPAVHFSVERFEPTADFQPSKPFVSRLLWRDQDGNIQSKLLLTEADDLIATAVRGEPTVIKGPQRAETRETAPRQRRRKASAVAEPGPQG